MGGLPGEAERPGSSCETTEHDNNNGAGHFVRAASGSRHGDTQYLPGVGAWLLVRGNDTNLPTRFRHRGGRALLLPCAMGVFRLGAA